MNKTPPLKEDPNFKPGMRVRILEGPFKEFRGKIIEIDQAAQTVKVSVNFFGKDREAGFEYTQIAPDQ